MNKILLSEAVEMALYARVFHVPQRSLRRASATPYLQEMKNITPSALLSSLPEDVLGSTLDSVRVFSLVDVLGGGYSEDRPARLALAEHGFSGRRLGWQVDSNRSELGEIRTVRAFLGWKQGVLPAPLISPGKRSFFYQRVSRNGAVPA